MNAGQSVGYLVGSVGRVPPWVLQHLKGKEAKGREREGRGGSSDEDSTEQVKESNVTGGKLYQSSF